MSYVSLQEMKAYIVTAATSADDILENCIEAAQKGIENYCHRVFQGSTGTRYFRAQDLISLSGLGPATAKVLWLSEDLLSISSLTNGDETTISSTSYWLEPRNRPPYQYIRLRTDETWVFNTDGEVTVAGTWGFSTGPDDMIKEVTKEYANYLYEARKNAVWDVTAIPELGQLVIPKGIPAHVKYALGKGGYVRKVVV